MQKQHLNKLLIAALKPEWSFLKQDLNFECDKKHAQLFHIKEIPSTALIQTGSGLEKAASSLNQVLNDYTPKSILHFGSSGGLRTGIMAEDLFVAHHYIYEDEEISINSNLSSELTNFLKKSDLCFHFGRLLSVQTALINKDEKAEASKKYHAQAVDMESFVMAKICREQGIDYLSVRAIFDSLEDDIENLGTPYDKKGDLKAGKLVANLVKSPNLILKLPSLQKRHQRICQNLKQVIRWYLSL